MIDQATFYRELMGPALAPATTPATPRTANSSTITGVVVRESAHDGHHPNRRRVVFLRVGQGNARHGNRYTEQAARALVAEIQRRPKVYLGHASEAAIHAGSERHLGDMTAAAVRETVHYDPATKQVVGEIECSPAALQVIDLAHAVGDTIGVSIEAVGQRASHGSSDIVGWLTYRGACLVPEGGAGGMTVREAATTAAYNDGYTYGYGETTISPSEEFLRELYAPHAQAAARAAAVRETAASDGPWDALVRETCAGLRAYYPQLTQGGASLITTRAKETWDPDSLVTWEETVTREAYAYVDTLPPPLGREGSIQFFDALIEARGGR